MYVVSYIMKVIVAGFPKTGTKTLNAALTKLGYKVYDYPENAFELGYKWGTIFRQGWSTEDFRKMYENIDAVVDAPACYFWEEIHKAFPEAKIILSLRDSDEEWLESYQQQMRVGVRRYMIFLLQCFSPSFRQLERNVDYPISVTMFGIPDIRLIGHKPYNKNLLKLKYRAHNAYVVQNAPADKLLVYKVTEGWDSLCKFLQVPVPDEPFPHKNKGGKDIVKYVRSHPVMRRMKQEMFFALLISTSILGVGGYCLWKR